MTSRKAARERGNALVEFTWLAILLMVPLVYLMLTVFQVQKAAYAMEAASREAARGFVTADDGADPKARAYAAARLAASDQGVELSADQVDVECDDACGPGDTVRVRVTTEVPLPFVPEFLSDRVSASVPVEATHNQVVDVYRDTSRP